MSAIITSHNLPSLPQDWRIASGDLNTLFIQDSDECVVFEKDFPSPLLETKDKKNEHEDHDQERIVRIILRRTQCTYKPTYNENEESWTYHSNKNDPTAPKTLGIWFCCGNPKNINTTVEELNLENLNHRSIISNALFFNGKSTFNEKFRWLGPYTYGMDLPILREASGVKTQSYCGYRIGELRNSVAKQVYDALSDYQLLTEPEANYFHAVSEHAGYHQPSQEESNLIPKLAKLLAEATAANKHERKHKQEHEHKYKHENQYKKLIECVHEFHDVSRKAEYPFVFNDLNKRRKDFLIFDQCDLALVLATRLQPIAPLCSLELLDILTQEQAFGCDLQSPFNWEALKMIGDILRTEAANLTKDASPAEINNARKLREKGLAYLLKFYKESFDQDYLNAFSEILGVHCGLDFGKMPKVTPAFTRSTFYNFKEVDLGKTTLPLIFFMANKIFASNIEAERKAKNEMPHSIENSIHVKSTSNTAADSKTSAEELTLHSTSASGLADNPADNPKNSLTNSPTDSLTDSLTPHLLPSGWIHVSGDLEKLKDISSKEKIIFEKKNEASDKHNTNLKINDTANVNTNNKTNAKIETKTNANIETKTNTKTDAKSDDEPYKLVRIVMDRFSFHRAWDYDETRMLWQERSPDDLYLDNNNNRPLNIWFCFANPNKSNDEIVKLHYNLHYDGPTQWFATLAKKMKLSEAAIAEINLRFRPYFYDTSELNNQSNFLIGDSRQKPQILSFAIGEMRETLAARLFDTLELHSVLTADECNYFKTLCQQYGHKVPTLEENNCIGNAFDALQQCKWDDVVRCAEKAHDFARRAEYGYLIDQPEKPCCDNDLNWEMFDQSDAALIIGKELEPLSPEHAIQVYRIISSKDAYGHFVDSPYAYEAALQICHVMISNLGNLFEANSRAETNEVRKYRQKVLFHIMDFIENFSGGRNPEMFIVFSELLGTHCGLGFSQMKRFEQIMNRSHNIDSIETWMPLICLLANEVYRINSETNKSLSLSDLGPAKPAVKPLQFSLQTNTSLNAKGTTMQNTASRAITSLDSDDEDESSTFDCLNFGSSS